MSQTSERIEITGSRIKTVDAEIASPVVSINAESIKVEGVRNVESLLNNLPQVFADQGAQVSNGASGISTVNLRNLGSTRTLVLVNGRRLPPGSPRDASADLNQIPISLIKRVEVLTGGASAIYGSDAVAGVINFILDDKFEGLQLDVNTQFYNHQQGNSIADVVRDRGFPVPGDKSADGQVHDFSVTLGGNFDGGKGNATIYFGYKKEKALLESERDFSACALNYNRAADLFTCGGSGTSFPGRFTDFDGIDLTVADASGDVRPWVAATDAYNFAPLNYFQRPSDRYTFNASGHYNFSDTLRGYTELSWHDDRTVAQIAPSGIFGLAGTGGANLTTVRFENPLLSDAWRNALGLNAPGDTKDLYIFRRNVEGGGRQDDIRHSSYRAVLGLEGDIGPWTYNASAQMGKVSFQETYFNDFSNTRIERALNVVTDPTTGNPVCASALDGTDPNCVPYNIWSLGNITPEALSYLQTPLFQRGTTQQRILTASITGDLGQYGLKSPMASNGLGVAFGVERRDEKLTLDTDANFTSGDGAGQGGPTIGLGGAYNVKEAFVEARLPLIEKKPFIELLNATASYRYSDYSTNKTTDTYGLGLEYVPVKQVKLRGSFQRAARAANIIELYEAQRIELYDNTGDPCAGANPAASLEQCARTGVTAAQYGGIPDSPAGQYNQLSGGNTNLEPEKSKSYTVGLVLNPIDNLNITVDYFNLEIEKVIGTAPPPQVLNLCLQTGNPLYCDLIQRDTVGSLWASPAAFIVATNLNLGKRKTSGIDLGADYSWRMPSLGRLDFGFNGTWLREFKSIDFPGSGEYDCAGLFGDTCSQGAVVAGVLPKWRHKLRTTWVTPWNLSLALTWRHLDSVKYEGDSGNPVLANNAGTQVAKLGARNYFDLSAAYDINKFVTVRGIVNNVFDKDPPIRTNGAGAVNGNTYPVVYDALGRKIGVSLTAKF